MMIARRPLALFTAGAPGAGKSTLAALLIRPLGIASHDPDAILDELEAAEPGACRIALLPRVFDVLEARQSALIAAGTPLIVNTTAADFAFVAEYRARLAAVGYACAMVMVRAPLTEALTRNRDRPHPIPEANVRAKHRAVGANAERLHALFAGAWWCVDNVRPGDLEAAAPGIVRGLAALAQPGIVPK